MSRASCATWSRPAHRPAARSDLEGADQLLAKIRGLELTECRHISGAPQKRIRRRTKQRTRNSHG